MAIRMLQRRGTTAQWASANPVLGDGEMGIDKTAGIIKIGNGEDPWAELDIVYEATPAVLSVFGRTGDVTMTSEDIEDLTAVGAALIGAGSPDEVLELLGASVIGTSILRAAGPTAVSTLLGVTTLGAAVMTATTAATIRSAAGITQTGAAVATAVDAPSARAAIGAGTGNGNGNVTGTGVLAITSLTQSAYDALATKSATTLYVIVG
jgi:hypothetical protein